MASILKKKQKKRDNKYTLSDLKTLGHQLLSSRSHINNLPLLLTFVNPNASPQFALESLLSLQSFFTPLLPDLPPSSSKHSSAAADSQEDPEFIYRTWLRSKFDEFVHSLIDIAISPQSEDTLREVVLDTIMEFVKVGNGGRFHSSIYHKLIDGTVHSALGVDLLLELLSSKYFKYTDVRYFTYISVEKLARTIDLKDTSDEETESLDADSNSQPRTSIELSIHKIHYILSHIPPLDGPKEASEYEMWNGLGIFVKDGNLKKQPKNLKVEAKQCKTMGVNNNVLSAANVAKKMKLKFTKAWISFLGLPLPLDVYKELPSSEVLIPWFPFVTLHVDIIFIMSVLWLMLLFLYENGMAKSGSYFGNCVLVNLHEIVIPHLSNPIMLCDFLTRSYDIGGVISVMALSSLYVLMTQHGLEYPNFYEKLYVLLEPSIFMAKHRAKFFQLLDSCLKSPLLPAYLAASFAKKLSRLALSVPPSGALVITALIHNLLRRHPSINCLVHREDIDETAKSNSREEKELGNNTEDSCTGIDTARKEPGIDLFNNEESDPMKTKALRSSLWEIDTLRHHYCPPVSRFVLSLENDLTVRSKTTEVAVKDFSSGSYATIFGEEMRRRVKQVPLAFYNTTPTSLFSESDFAGWTFKCKENDDLPDQSAKRQRVGCA